MMSALEMMQAGCPNCPFPSGCQCENCVVRSNAIEQAEADGLDTGWLFSNSDED